VTRLAQARDEALETAQQRASYYAGKPGARMVRLLSVTEGAQGRSYGHDMMYANTQSMSVVSAESAPPPPSPVESGRIATSVTLFVQYALER